MYIIRELPKHLSSTPTYVFCQDKLAGQLFRDAEGATFLYDEAYRTNPGSTAVAFTLPKTEARHRVDGVGVHPFFANLLPEGWVLEAVAHRIKTSRDDLLSLLIALGRDTIGDVWLDWEREPPPASEGKEWDLRQSSFDDILTTQYDDPRRPPEPVSLPGVQEKVSASRITIVDLRAKGQPAILKLNRNERRYPNLVGNESFFMGLAARCGLKTPRTKVVRDCEGTAALWVERFDRLVEDGKVRRLHLEDFCQLTGRYPKDKYNVSARDVAELLPQVCSAPKVELLNFLRLYAFSWLIGNGDLHGKNLSVLTRPDGLRTLSPVYDMVSTLPYKDRTMAFPMDGRDANFRTWHFVEFGERHGLPGPVVQTMLAKLIAKVAAGLPLLPSAGFDERTETFIRSTIETRLAEMADLR